MKTRTSGVCFCAAFLLVGIASTQTSKEMMLRMVVHLQSSGLAEGSFATMPKTIYRSVTRYCRIEESPDLQNGIHGLVVINEPDIWMVNLSSKTGQHQSDPGPTFNCRMPIFGEDQHNGSPGKLDLEFGHELAFFKEHHAALKPGPTLQNQATKAYVLESGDTLVVLFTSVATERPVAVRRQQGNNSETYWYGS